MIKAEHKKWALILFDFYISRLLRKNFNRFISVNEFPILPENKSIVAAPNHFSWWDGFFIDYTFKKFSSKKLHLLMLEEQLKRYWFFGKVGAYSINFANAKSMANTISYTQDILKDPNNFAVIFPQGEIQPYDVSPVILKEGLKLMLRNSNEDTLVMPIAFKILHGKEKYPDVLVRFGEILEPSAVKNNWQNFTEKFSENIIELNKAKPDVYKKNLFEI